MELIYSLESIKSSLEMNYEEMDFENADKKRKMEKIISEMQNDIKQTIRELKSLSFES